MVHKLPQMLGLTNYSRWADAGALRACAAADEPAAERLQAAALARLRALAHVGLTERLEESIASLAASLGLRMDGPAWKVCWHCRRVTCKDTPVCLFSLQAQRACTVF